MSVRVINNMPKILADFNNSGSLAFRFLVDDVHRIANPNTPKDKGPLRDTVQKEVQGLKAKITWTRRYAAIQETTQFRNYTTPGTGPHFAENAARAGSKNAMTSFRKARFVK